MNFVDNVPTFHEKKMSHDTSHIEWIYWIKYLGQESMETEIQHMNGKSYCNYLWSVPRQVEPKKLKRSPEGHHRAVEMDETLEKQQASLEKQTN